MSVACFAPKMFQNELSWLLFYLISFLQCNQAMAAFVPLSNWVFQKKRCCFKSTVTPPSHSRDLQNSQRNTSAQPTPQKYLKILVDQPLLVGHFRTTIISPMLSKW